MENDGIPTRTPRRGSVSFLLGAGVTLLAGILRFVRLDIPKSLIPLDEFYYPVNALGLLRHGADYQLATGAKLPGRCASVAIEPAFAVHPPVGKWLIAAGMKLFGCNSYGWRVAAAVFGTATVLLVFLIARRLFRSPWIAALAAFLVAVDGLFFVQSRIAMLDVFLAFFITLAVWLLVEDRARAANRAPRVRWCRIGSAVAIGLGVATKWSAMFVIPFLFVLALAWEIERRRAARRVAAPVSVVAPLESGAPLEAGAIADTGEWSEPERHEDTATIPAELETDAGADDLYAVHPGWTPREREPAPGPVGLEPGDLEPGDPALQAPDPQQPEETSPEATDPDAEVDGHPAIAPPPPWEPSAPDALPEPPPSWQEISPVPARPRGGWAGEVLRLGALFSLLPMLVYFVSYLPWFAAGDARYKAPRCATPAGIEFTGTFSPVNSKVWNADVWPDSVKEWVCYQREIWDFHKNLKTIDKDGKPTHPYLARAWSWPWMGRPTSHYFDTKGSDEPCGEKPSALAQRSYRAAQISSAQVSSPAGTASAATTPSPAPSPAPVDASRPCKTEAEILGLPNPAMWLVAFFLAIPFAIWRAFVRRDQVAALLLMLFAPLFLPWLVTTRPLFLFYMTPAVPILALFVAHLADRVTEEMRAWQQTIVFALMLTVPFAPLYIQWLHAGERSHLLYKIPALAVIFLVANGLATLLAYTAKPRRLILLYAGLVLAMFAYFYPVLAAVHIPDGGTFGWRKHMWLQRDCGEQGILLTCWI